jgi:aminomethyltransferase
MLRLKTTPFHSRTTELMQANQWRRWGGYSVASAYEMTHDREYLAVRNAAALFDVSALYKYDIRGHEAGEFLNRLVTRQIGTLKVNDMAYTPWCDSQGKVVDDGTIARLGDHHYRLTAADPNLHWLEQNAEGFEVEIEDVSGQIGTLALQGPCSRDILAECFGDELRSLPFYGVAQIGDLIFTRTGYTGDLGYEIWAPKDRCPEVWDQLMTVGKRYALQPAGIWALDVARIEAGLIMLDVDYTPSNKATTPAQASTPFELGLGWAVHFKKSHFVGKKALAKEKEQGSVYHLVGLEVDHQALTRAYESLSLPVQFPFVPWREVVPIFQGQEQVGYATCGCWSPTLKKYLCLAQIHPPQALPETVLSIDLLVDRFRKSFPVTVKKLPFYNPERKRGLP